ncbi:YhjD/YihY/BrkB family envelope integrity protein [Actinacidiphila bryophytorum]|uniref:Ribonuclease BN n=1 Tax=Actinacidiphila bryophytorum TaxID=1436133 RepID=A0A9W4GYN9_9ACTN|nr:YhjD/YihY/BrkB family envelope integrity protein [Actinacidiphila bryophytorum]CAG7618318.1 Ribonuclease BN [Actinacidiphila bryophytorum]
MSHEDEATSGPEGRWPRWRRRWDASSAALVVRRGAEMELMARALSFAALSLLTLLPLVTLVGAVDPHSGLGAGKFLGRVLGLSPSSQERISELVVNPAQTLRRTTAFGLAVLAAFGLTFGTALQTGYEKTWNLRAAHWHALWRHVIWLALFVGYLLVAVAALGHGTTVGEQAVGGTATVAVSLLFFWWSQRFLLVGRVTWRALLPGAVATTLGLVGLRIFSGLVFSPLIASNAVTYGPVGTILVVQSWLTGVGFVVYGGAVLGRVLHQRHTAQGRAGDSSRR